VGYAGDLYKLIRSHPLPFEAHLGGLTFANPRDAVHLQAADLLCYLIAQHMPFRLKDKNAVVPTNLRQAMTNAKSPKDFPVYNKSELLQQVKNAKVPLDWYLERGHIDGKF
jgi:hypothetical protein